MKKINLLPPKVQKVNDVRRLTIIIAAVQAVIFLAVFLLYVLFSVWEAQLNREAQSLDRLLRDSFVEQSVNDTFHFFWHEEFLTKDALVNVHIVPSGVRLYALTFNYGEFSISAHTEDIMNIQAHIELLSEHFYNVRLASLAATDNSFYVYELILMTR